MAQHKVKCWLLLNVVISKCAFIFQLFACKPETLLFWWDSLFDLDFDFYNFNCVHSLHPYSDVFSSESLHKNSQTGRQVLWKVKNWLLLNVVISECVVIFQLLACKEETLVVWWNSLLVLDFGFHFFDCVPDPNLKSNGFPSESLHKNHSGLAQHKVKSWLCLNVVISKCVVILQLLACINETLLAWWDSFLIVELGFQIFNCVTDLKLESDDFPSESLHKDLNTTTKLQLKAKGRLLLDVVIREGVAIFQVRIIKEEMLLVWWDSLVVLDFGFYVFNCVTSLNHESDGFSWDTLHKDWTQAQHKVKCCLFRNVVVSKCAAILQLLACINETLLV